MRLQRLYIVRHGETVYGTEPRFLGITDVGLSEKGKSQAGDARLHLQHLDFEAVYCSALSRTIETAAIICDGIHKQAVSDPVWNEINLGEWDGRSFADIHEKYPEQIAEQRRNLADFRITGGETFREMQTRVVGGLEKLFETHTEKNVLLICHAGVIRSIVSHVLKSPLDAQFFLKLDYCGISILERTPQNRLLLRRVNVRP